MTLCVGYTSRNGAVLMSDTRLADEDGPPETVEKVFRAHGVVWAFSGEWIYKQHLCAVSCREYSAKADFESWWMQDLLPVFQHRINNFIREEIKEQGCNMLAVAGGVLYNIGDSYEAVRVGSGTIACIGSGAPFARGAVAYAGRSGFSFAKLYRAVASLDPYVGPPFYTYNVTRRGKITKGELT